ncbi:hypothetical protein ACWDV4_17110 [Micromonospora sp. NPDC003197]
MGIDLELADCAAAGYQLAACRRLGLVCAHNPDCKENYDRLRAQASADRPNEDHPWEFHYRRFQDINQNMQLTGMGYPAEPASWAAFTANPDCAQALPEQEDAWLRWRSQTSPGRIGIPAFKLESNDRWLVTVREIDEALAAYANTPAELRDLLEADPKWVSWLEWLAVARKHGGFEAE